MDLKLENVFFSITGFLSQLVGVLVFSAFPFVAVKAIANSPVGEKLQRRLEKRKEEAKADSDKANKSRLAARATRLLRLHFILIILST